jgi:hypothetical protein
VLGLHSHVLATREAKIKEGQGRQKKRVFAAVMSHLQPALHFFLLQGSKTTQVCMQVREGHNTALGASCCILNEEESFHGASG